MTTGRKLKAVSATAMIIRGSALSAQELPIYERLLEQYTVDQVDNALLRVQRECEFFNPKAVISRINDGRPEVEEAWSLVRFDESSTFVMTDEMSIAFGVALEIYNEDGDRIAARMAFKEKYTSELANARAQGSKAKWFISAGTDKSGQEKAVKEALQLGRISDRQALGYIKTKSDGVIEKMLSGSGIKQLEAL